MWWAVVLTWRDALALLVVYGVCGVLLLMGDRPLRLRYVFGVWAGFLVVLTGVFLVNLTVGGFF